MCDDLVISTPLLIEQNDEKKMELSLEKSQEAPIQLSSLQPSDAPIQLSSLQPSDAPIQLSSLQPSDAPMLYALFSQCFPVHYPYKDISDLCVPSKKYFTVCVVGKIKNEETNNMLPSFNLKDVRNSEECMGKYVVTTLNNPDSLVIPVATKYSVNANAEYSEEVSVNTGFSRAIYGFAIVQFEYASQMPQECWEMFLNNTYKARWMKAAHLLSFGTHPQMRRKGIAQMMMNYMIEELKNRGNCIGVYLHTLATNTPAKCFYEKNLFLRSVIIRNYYHLANGDTGDAYIYCLELPKKKKLGKRLVCVIL